MSAPAGGYGARRVSNRSGETFAHDPGRHAPRGRERRRSHAGRCGDPAARPPRPPQAAAAWVIVAALSPDGRTLALGAEDGTVELLDLSTGRRRAAAGRQEPTSVAVAFSPDGATLATGGVDGRVMVWDVASGQVRETFQGHEGRIGRDCASAPTATRSTPRPPGASSRGTWRAPTGSGGRSRSVRDPEPGPSKLASRSVRTARSWPRPTAGGPTRSRCATPLAQADQAAAGARDRPDLGDRVRPRRQAPGPRWRRAQGPRAGRRRLRGRSRGG